MIVLVTGGAGMIGSHLVDRLVADETEVRILDNLDPRVHQGGRRPSYLNHKAEFIWGDVRDRALLRASLADVDVVVHLAAIVGGLQSQYRNHEYVDVGLGGTALLLDLLIHEFQGVRRVVVASSAAIYGEGKYECARCGVFYPDGRRESSAGFDPICPKCGLSGSPLPADEATPPRPASTYAIVKKGQEDLVLNFGRTYGRHAAALRFFSVYGPRQSLSNPYSGIISVFANRILNGLPPVVYEDGLQLRDFVFVHDAVEAILAALLRPDCSGKALNVAGGEPRRVMDVAAEVAGVLGKEMEPEIRGTVRKGDVRHCVADLNASGEWLGFAPRVSFSEGVRELVTWAAQHKLSGDVFDAGARELAHHGIA